MNWIVEDSDFYSNSKLIKYLTSIERPIIRIEEYPINNENKLSNVNGPICCYGAIRTISRLNAFTDYVIDDFKLLQCSSYYPAVLKYMKRKFFFIPLIALPTVQHLFGSHLFVRPDSAMKHFNGQVLHVDEISQFMDTVREHHKSDLVVVSEVIDMGSEYRCFVRNGKVFCSSKAFINWDDGGSHFETVPTEVIMFAEAIAEDLCKIGLTMCSIDVSKSPRDNELRLVEVNGVNSAGLYCCDIPAFVAEMEAESEMIQKMYE